MVTPDQLQCLRSDFVDVDLAPDETPELKVFTITDDNLNRLYTVSHFPRRGGKGNHVEKLQSTAIRDSLLTCPGAKEVIENSICWDRWDLLIELKGSCNQTLLAQQALNWENFTLKHLMNQTTVRVSQQIHRLSPPEVWLEHPASVNPLQLIHQLREHIEIMDHHPGTAHTHWHLRLRDPSIAQRLLGCSIPCGALGIAYLTSGDASFDTSTSTTVGVH
jgi:hypothetical protein